MKLKRFGYLTAGLVLGITLSGPVAHAAETVLKVLPSTQKFYLDGEPIRLEAYNINGYNYIKLGDLCPALGVALVYDGTTNSVYIGERPAPEEQRIVEIPQSDAKLTLKVGDKVRCDDGRFYEIKDMSRYDSNVFADGPVGELPSATCNWALFPELTLPRADVRHFSNSAGDTLFVRNLHETRRMQYTIYNALGSEPSAWRGDAPLATVELSIPADLELYTEAFWPWRASELTDMVHSRPNSQYYVEAWDYYLNGVFQYTRYCVVSQ